MELLVQILLLFIIVASVLRLSFERGWIIPTLFAVVAAVFVYLTYPYAIEQTRQASQPISPTARYVSMQPSSSRWMWHSSWPTASPV